VGVEHRRESQEVTADPLGAVNGFTSSGNAAPFAADFDVTEGYVEAIAPLVRDSFLKSADLNAAVRYADYSTVGGQTTWKVGLTLQPIDGLRLRGTRSRDIRAPALFELYSRGSDVTNNVTVLNPVTKASQNPRIPQNTNVGNVNLDPEIADTYTIGAVLEPGGGLRASLDYYDIEINGAVANLSAANIGTLCTQEINAGAPGQFCRYFSFTAGGVATRLDAPTLNLGSFHNSGFDVALSYDKELSDWGMNGSARITFSGTYVTHADVNTGAPGAGVIDRAGENGAANLGGIPNFRGNLSLAYESKGGFSLTNQLLYISEGKNDVTYDTAPSLTINDNSIPAVVYWNIYATAKVSENFELFGRIDNALNRDPPVSPYAVINSPVNGQYYDKVGRAFTIGVRLRK
jgi:outer membrane receptor protein involved in Fe transport